MNFQKLHSLFSKIMFLLVILTGAVIISIVYIYNTANAQVNTEETFSVPFISPIQARMNFYGAETDFQNTQQGQQSIMQNSERDIVFIENLGQIRDSEGNKRPDVLFLTRSQGVDMYITSTGITYVFRGNPPLRGKTEGDVRESLSDRQAGAVMLKDKVEEPKASLYRLDMEFVGMNKNINIKKELAVEQQFNYYTPEYPNGISPKGFKKITIKNIYDGIDLVYYEKEGKMKYDFIIKAGADAKKIKMNYEGAEKVYVDKDGSIIITTPMGEIREEKPYTYSRNTGKLIESSYKVINNLVQFNIAGHNTNEDIVIDPYRIWATYYGGSRQDLGYGICTDNLGNLYVTGYTQSTNFPTQTLPGAYNQTTYGGGWADAFILKFNSSGARVWATYYGGNMTEEGKSIWIDNSNNLYATGYTSSADFPTQTLTGAYNQTTSGGGYDAFILKFNNSGVRVWATFYGGSDYESGYGVCTDNIGDLYVTGLTKSSNFPTQTLTGAYNQTTFGGGDSDVFILKFSGSGARVWATYYGGGSHENGYGICTNNSDALYVTGSTKSTNFPTQILTGAYNQTTYGGGILDAFILKFNSSGARMWATYYGGNNWDAGYSICTDNSNDLYVTGETESTNFPTQTLTGAYNQTTSGGSRDAFILKFNDSNARIWATYYGGSMNDNGDGICTDNSGNLYVTGSTKSTNFPTQILTGAYNQTTYGGGILDAFILKFNSSGARQWATYYGGSYIDQGKSVYTNASNDLYVIGFTKSFNFPTKILTGAYNQTTLSGAFHDVFILKFSPTPVAIKNTSNEIPAKYSLFQNYPNPFNPTTTIRFAISDVRFTILKVYDALGKEVATLVNEELPAGSYKVDFNGEGLSNGVYFYRLEAMPDGRQAGEFMETRKMLLIK